MDIRKLILQREPMLMTDEYEPTDDNTALTTFEVKASNIFIEDGVLCEAAVIEHQAQSASAMAGKRALDRGAASAPVGYIGEVRHFHCTERPRVGDILRTKVEWGTTVGPFAFVNATTTVDGRKIAEGQLKVYIKES
ncbi:MAG: beta-hydroxyacyl-ACP dehydratase [Prevotella sp.]|jgi:predicted hotdog family 3-hydroxylacyl-ACP dehydratase